jgi:hypothetical protein
MGGEGNPVVPSDVGAQVEGPLPEVVGMLPRPHQARLGFLAIRRSEKSGIDQMHVGVPDRRGKTPIISWPGQDGQGRGTIRPGTVCIGATAEKARGKKPEQ